MFHLRVLVFALALSALLIVAVASATPRHAGTAYAQPTCNPKIDHLEITQAIQQGNNQSDPRWELEAYPGGTPPGGYLPPRMFVHLIDGRNTAFRAFVKEDNGGAGCPDDNGDGAPDIGGVFFVHGPTDAFLAAGLLVNSPTDLVPPWDRDTEKSTLNGYFYPTGSQSSGTRNLELHACGGTMQFTQHPQTGAIIGYSVEPTHCVYQYLEFEGRRQPHFLGVPIRYDVDHANIAPPEDSLIDEEPGDAVFAMWPFPDGQGGGGYRLLDRALTWWQHGLAGEVNQYDFAGWLAEHQCNLQRDRSQEHVDYIFGWLPDGSDLGTAAGFGVIRGHQGGATADSNAPYQLTYGHELGHNFGFEHGGGGIGQTGWDVKWRLRGLFPDMFVRPTGLEQIMYDYGGEWVNTYGNPLSGGGYQNVIDRDPVDAYARFVMTGPCRSRRPGFSESQFLVSGLMPGDPAEPAYLHPLFEVPHGPWDTTPAAQGGGQIRILDAHDQELYSTAFEYEAGAGNYSYVMVPVPAITGSHTIELYREGILQDSVSRSPNVPQVTVLSPSAGTTLTDTLAIEWTATDADGGPLHSYVLFSHDNEVSWLPLAVRPEQNQILVDTAGIPSSDAALLRVLVTDGINTGMADVTDLLVQPDRPPRVTIDSPDDGHVYEPGTNVVLLASVFDLEEGWLTPDTVAWSSNLDGPLGTGALNTDQLSAGTHVITATVSVAGGPSSDSVTITIGVP